MVPISPKKLTAKYSDVVLEQSGIKKNGSI